MTAHLQIQLIAIFIAIACSLSGTFLILRKMSMMSDAITHTVLLGIVLAYLFVQDLSSPFLMIGATCMGVITVWLIETFMKLKLVSCDSAIGIVFPLLFSIAIILITKYASSVHLDIDSVMLGELAFAPFDSFYLNGVNIGAKSLYTSLGLTLFNVIVLSLFYKELKVTTFDPLLAATMGISPIIVHYLLMTMVSITAVGAFQSVGSVLVIAFMIIPGNTAYLLTKNLSCMLLLSVIFAILSGIIGFQIAYFFDVSIAGCMAVVSGVLFTIAFLFSLFF